MFVMKWVSILAFFVMVAAGIYHFASEESRASKVCYIAAGVFVCGMFYVTTLHKIFPKSDMGDRVADILEKTVEARQMALMHHIQHSHQSDFAAMRQLRSPQQEKSPVIASIEWSVQEAKIAEARESDKWERLQQSDE